MSTILILGGGFGGLSCARALRARLAPEHRILVCDRSRDFVVGAAKTWVMVGHRTANQVATPRRALLPPGVELVETEVSSLDPARREAKTATLGTLAADFLVVALGATLDMDAVPGLEEAAHTFYTLPGAERLNRALARFAGGHVVILIPRTPFQCPPGPYEGALMLHAHLERLGLRAKTRLEIWTVEKAPMATAGQEMGKRVVAEIEARGIGFHPLKKALSVDAADRRVRFEDGTETAFDLLVAIPPHRVPGLLVEAGLAETGGWIPVDPATLEVKRPGSERLFAIGDATGLMLPGRFDPSVPLALPKAGVFAASEGEVVAARIAASISGSRADTTFDGRGYCYLEVGGGRALRAEGAFFETPHPVMTASAPDEAQYRDKVTWVERWLSPVA